MRSRYRRGPASSREPGHGQAGHLFTECLSAMAGAHPVARVHTTFGIGTRRGYAGALSTTVADLTGRMPAPATCSRPTAPRCKPPEAADQTRCAS